METRSSRPSSLRFRPGVSSYPTYNCSGYLAVFVKEYISTLTGLPVVVNSGTVIVYNPGGVPRRVFSAPRVTKYVDQKYAKMESFIPAMANAAAADNILDISNLIKLYYMLIIICE